MAVRRSGIPVALTGGHRETTMKIRTQIKAGGQNLNHNESLKVRSAVKAGYAGNHNETMLETQLLIHPPGTSRSAGAPALSVGASYKHAAPPEQRPTLKLYVDRVAIL